MENNYTELFKEARLIKDNSEKKYIDDHQLFGERIYSLEHPEFFKYNEEWKLIRNKLDAPLLENAYYKIGDMVFFVKKNTYITKNKTPNSLKMKDFKSYTIFDEKDNDVSVTNPIISEFFYENILSNGIIPSIKTSDCGSGKIFYNLKNITPECPESNAYVMEENIITGNMFN